MTPLESEALQRFRLDCLSRIRPLSIFVFFYGVFLVLFSASVVIFTRRGFSKRATAAMFAATIINFILSSLNTGTLVASFVIDIRMALNLDHPLPEESESVNRVLRNVILVCLWSIWLPIWLSDLVVIWRAWALFQDRQWVVFIPLVMWIAGFGMILGDQIWISIPNDFGQYYSSLHNSISDAAMVLSFATNAITTMMIAYKLWSYRTFVANTLGLRRRKSRVQAVMILLVESGLVFLIIHVLCMALEPNNIPDFKALGLQAVYLSLAAMYPTLVVVLIETQRSMTDICEISRLNGSKPAGPVASEACPQAATLGHLSFAVGLVHSVTTDKKAEFQCSRSLRSQAEPEYGIGVILDVKESQLDTTYDG